MKKIILGLILLAASLNALATDQYIIYPRVYKLFNQVRVEVWNYTENVITCSGWVHINFITNNFDTQYYTETIYPHMNSYQTIYPRFPDEISFVTNDIYCR